MRRTKRPSAFVTQSLAGFDENRSVLENMRDVSRMSEAELRNALARFLFRRDHVFQKVSELSGGERLRLELARALLKPEPADVLFLDEPTNHLDLFNVEFLEGFLKNYAGALLIASHDFEFLKRVGIDAEIQLRR